MHALNLAAVFVRDQVRGFPALHRWLTDLVYADIVKRHPPVLSVRESIDIIARDNASVGRYGDGEYKLCRGKPLRFQRNSAELTAKLREILYCDTPNFYAAVLPLDRPGSSAFLRNVLAHNYRIISKLGTRPRLNSFVSHTLNCRRDLDRMKQIWQGRKIILMTNIKTKQMAMDCGLFANASRQNFIEAPGTEAFDRHATLLQQAKRHSKDALFLLACGPTATVLAHELHLCGYQAVDIGCFVDKSFAYLRGHNV